MYDIQYSVLLVYIMVEQWVSLGKKNYTCIMCTPTSDHHFTFKIEHIIIKVLQ